MDTLFLCSPSPPSSSRTPTAKSSRKATCWGTRPSCTSRGIPA